MLIPRYTKVSHLNQKIQIRSLHLETKLRAFHAQKTVNVAKTERDYRIKK